MPPDNNTPAPVEATSADVAEVNGLSAMIASAAHALAGATTPAEFLDAIHRTTFAYDAARTTARLHKAQAAHAEVIAACRKAQGDALEIEAQAQARLADEYDAAQDRGEAARPGEYARANIPNKNISPTVAEIGLTSKIVHEARQVRDAERRDPGIIRRTVDARLNEGVAPTHADIRRAITPRPIVTAPTPTFTPPTPAPRTATPPRDEQPEPIAPEEDVEPDWSAEIEWIRAEIKWREVAVGAHYGYLDDTHRRMSIVPVVVEGQPLHYVVFDAEGRPDEVGGAGTVEAAKALAHRYIIGLTIDDAISGVAHAVQIAINGLASLAARPGELTEMQRAMVSGMLWNTFENAKALHDGFVTRLREGAQ